MLVPKYGACWFSKCQVWLLAVAFLVSTDSVSFACPDGQYDGGFGMCLPEIGGDVGNAAEHAKNEIKAQILGNPLEQWIIASRNTAINGAMPIPQNIRQMLTGYASEDSMNRARFKIGDNGFLNLAHNLEQGGFASAVTLIDVIVFRGPSEANDPATWAHELTHVDQYASWGVHSFSIQYARNYNDVESPAYAKQNGFWPWYNSHHMVQPYQPPPAYYANVGAFCYTFYGRFGPGPVQPVGTPCWVNGMQGQVGH